MSVLFRLELAEPDDRHPWLLLAHDTRGPVSQALTDNLRELLWALLRRRLSSQPEPER